MAITQDLNKLMVDHQLDLTGFEGYDGKSIEHTDDDLIRVVYGTPSFPFIEFL